MNRSEPTAPGYKTLTHQPTRTHMDSPWRTIESALAAVVSIAVVVVAVQATQTDLSRADILAVFAGLVSGLGILGSSYVLCFGEQAAIEWADRTPATALTTVGAGVGMIGLWAFRPWLSSITGLLYLMPTVLSSVGGAVLAVVGVWWCRERHVYRPLGVLIVIAFVATAYNSTVLV